MKRIGILVCAVAALLPFASARAGSYSGVVRLAAGAPNVQRMATATHLAPNGTFGYVVDLGSGVNNQPFVLTLDRGATHAESLDVYFYYDLSGAGDPCPIARDIRQDGKTQTGTACPGTSEKAARYAIVVLNVGADARFTLSV